MAITIEERTFQLFWQDRRDREGSAIEAVELPGETLVLEVFCPDYSDRLYLTTFLPAIPVGLVEAALERAKIRLPEPPEEPASP